MKLTGKCEEDFEKWYENTYKEYDCYQVMDWFEYPFEFQYGVLVDFFDSVGVQIWIELWGNQNNGVDFEYFQVWIDFAEFSDYNETRQEARTKAIEKANEIYNNK